MIWWGYLHLCVATLASGAPDDRLGHAKPCYSQPSHPPSQSTLNLSHFSHICIFIVISAFFFRHFIPRQTRLSIFVISLNNPFPLAVFFSSSRIVSASSVQEHSGLFSQLQQAHPYSASSMAGATHCLAPLARTTL